ncbi:MAG: RNA methyltransferase [Hydrogenoanaerobacterium sp.]
MEKITARENQNIKRVVRLISSKKARDESGFFVAEGIKLCTEALAAGIRITELYCTAAALEKYKKELLLLCQNAEAVTEITDDISSKLAETVTPQGVFAVCATPQSKLLEDDLPQGHYIALEALQDPGNLGTVIRTADALGADGIILTAECPDIFSPKVLRSTMGSAFRVKICRTKNLAGLLHSCNKTHATFAATLNEKAVSLRACSFAGSAIVAIGNEGNGLSQCVIDACSKSLIIDMKGGAESLNAAVAASIILWEMSK